ncbi:hypothetical protein OH76DRAFT_1403963 [Lentinus brumalis]|uniref:Uncharacterized protein n=1 Tax=Lentinus brumalis TaxID=2498619 RepID=A0A371D963_9APHY|nr:hypothetical protein OH76DRAFT_1403963 [Polyporus brumalis]
MPSISKIDNSCSLNEPLVWCKPARTVSHSKGGDELAATKYLSDRLQCPEKPQRSDRRDLQRDVDLKDLSSFRVGT